MSNQAAAERPSLCVLVVGLYESNAASVVPQVSRPHVDVLRPEDLPILVRRERYVSTSPGVTGGGVFLIGSENAA